VITSTSNKLDPLLDNKLQPLDDVADDEPQMQKKPLYSATNTDNEPFSLSETLSTDYSELLKYYPF
jgi:hypothetical protein